MTIKFNKLTRANQRALSSGGKLSEHGIDFEKLPNGDGRYTISVMVDGRRIHRVLGKESEGVTRLEAEELIAKLRTDARQGRLHLTKGRKLVLSFREAAEKYLQKQREEGGKNYRRKEGELQRNLIPFFAGTPLDQISTSEIERYKKSRSEKNFKNSTINRDLATLSHLFSKAVDWKWLEKKPGKIERLKEEETRITYLTIEQINRLLETAQQDQNPQIYPFVTIGLETAMRRMEILRTRLEHIDLERKVIFIPQAKAGMRQQPITTHLADILRHYVQSAKPGQEWLFPSEKSVTGYTVSIEKVFRRVVKEAGLNPQEVVRHTLRHTAITHLVQAGIDLPTVKRISGHKTLKMVERYSHQNGSHIQAAMDKLEQRYQFTETKT